MEVITIKTALALLFAAVAVGISLMPVNHPVNIRLDQVHTDAVAQQSGGPFGPVYGRTLRVENYGEIL